LEAPKIGSVARQTENVVDAFPIGRHCGRQMTSVNKALTGNTTFKRKFATVIQPVDAIAIKPLIAHLHPGTERAHSRKILYRETNRLRGCSEAAIAERLARATFALRHEQFGRRAVIEFHSLAFAVTMRD
jgi:hypothetical protein